MNEIMQILNNAVSEKNPFLIDNMTFLASAIVAVVVTMVSPPVGSCGKSECESHLACLRNGEDCPEELTV